MNGSERNSKSEKFVRTIEVLYRRAFRRSNDELSERIIAYNSGQLDDTGHPENAIAIIEALNASLAGKNSQIEYILDEEGNQIIGQLRDKEN